MYCLYFILLYTLSHFSMHVNLLLTVIYSAMAYCRNYIKITLTLISIYESFSEPFKNQHG